MREPAVLRGHLQLAGPDQDALAVCAELAQGARLVGLSRSLQQLVQPMGAGKSFGTLSTGGGKFGPMAGGGAKTAAASAGGDGSDVTPQATGLVSRCGAASKPRNQCSCV